MNRIAARKRIGAEAVAEKGWLRAHKWLILRRISQFGILALFMLGPLAGIWIVKGNLNYSYTLNFLPLTDPYVALQSLMTGHVPETLGLIGVAVVLVFYLLVGGRVYCSWVCPVNVVTDAAGWLRDRLGIKGGSSLSRNTRYWILAMTLLGSALTGVVLLDRGHRRFPVRPVRHDAWLVRSTLSGGRFLQPARPLEPAAGFGAAPRRLQRLHGLLRSLPRAAGHSPGAERRGQGGRAGDSGGQLHQLRTLHRCLLERGVFLRAALQQPDIDRQDGMILTAK
jgi:hypothetical protein